MRPKSTRPVDPELRSILPSIPVGTVTSLLIAVAATPYLLGSLDQPHRAEIGVLLGVGAVVAIAILVLPRQALLASSLRVPFFLAWSAFDAALIAAVAILDGGTGSPFIVLLFLTQAFAALFYTLPMVVAAAAMNLMALAATAWLGPVNDVDQTLFFASCLVATAVLCSWQARNASAHRRELARASRTDPLTGCLNRRGFEERLGEELNRARRNRTTFVLIVLDLDQFKVVNDENGHAAGDRLLIDIVHSLAPIVRGMDSVGRLGGDEFALLFPGADQSDLSALIARACSAISRLADCSTGAATFPSDGVTTDALLSAADKRMYETKRRKAAAEAQASLWLMRR